MAVMAGRMNDGGNNHSLGGFINLIDDTVGKSIGITPADVFVLVTTGTNQRAFSERIPDLNYLLNKFRAETGLLGFIPAGGFGDVLFDFRSNHHPPASF